MNKILKHKIWVNSNSYNKVEILHFSLLAIIVDMIIVKQYINQTYKMKKILITGADGFIGSHDGGKTCDDKRFQSICNNLVQYNSIGSNYWLENIDLKVKKKLTTFQEYKG